MEQNFSRIRYNLPQNLLEMIKAELADDGPVDKSLRAAARAEMPYLDTTPTLDSVSGGERGSGDATVS